MTTAAIFLRVAFITALVNFSKLLTVAAGSTVAANDLVPLDHASFADSLTTQLYSGGSSNECSSSLGVSMAFSLVYPAAEGESEVQIRDVLTYPSDSQSQGLIWDDTATRLTSANEGKCVRDGYAGDCALFAPTIKIANRVYVNGNINLNPSYAESIGEYVKQLDFSDGDAAEQINEWVDKSTDGLIDSIVDSGHISKDTALIAINSIYLKAGWAYKFKTEQTSEESFYTTPSRSTELEQKAHFMHQVSAFDYSDTALEGFQVLKLPFAGSESLYMILVLPFREDGGETLVGSKDVLEVLPLLENTDVALGIPKFEFESRYEDTLKAALQSLGATAPFAGGLCIEAGNCGASIGQVIQKTYIGVDEKGVEAAAVTAISAMRASFTVGRKEAKLFLADHPMQFFIYDQNEDLVFFEGRVARPDIPEGSSAGSSSQHKDVDFWKNGFQTDVVLPDMSLLPDNSNSLLTKAVQGEVMSTNKVMAMDTKDTAMDTGTAMDTKDMAMDTGMAMDTKDMAMDTATAMGTKDMAMDTSSSFCSAFLLQKAAMIMFASVLFMSLV